MPPKRTLSFWLRVRQSCARFLLLSRAYLATRRPFEVLAAFIITAGLFLWILDIVLSLALWHPLAVVLFALSGRAATPDAHLSRTAPSFSSQFAIGALESAPTALNYASLPFRRPEADLILSYLQPSNTFLEFGASGTTLSFPHRVQFYYSIEHNSALCSVVGRELESHSDLDNLRAFCADVPVAPEDVFAEGSFRTFQSYVDFPRQNLSGTEFDRVLINGRARVACALRVLPQLHSTSLVFFHDFFRRPKHYATIFKYYDEVARVVAHADAPSRSDAPLGLIVLRPKQQYTGPNGGGTDISEDEIHELYETENGEPRDLDLDEAVARLPNAATSVSTSPLKYISNTLEGGFPYYEWASKVSSESSKMRILIDVIAFPFYAALLWALHLLLMNIFLSALGSDRHSTRSNSGKRGRNEVHSWITSPAKEIKVSDTRDRVVLEERSIEDIEAGSGSIAKAD